MRCRVLVRRRRLARLDRADAAQRGVVPGLSRRLGTRFSPNGDLLTFGSRIGGRHGRKHAAPRPADRAWPSGRRSPARSRSTGPAPTASASTSRTPACRCSWRGCCSGCRPGAAIVAASAAGVGGRHARARSAAIRGRRISDRAAQDAAPLARCPVRSASSGWGSTPPTGGCSLPRRRAPAALDDPPLAPVAAPHRGRLGRDHPGARWADLADDADVAGPDHHRASRRRPADGHVGRHRRRRRPRRGLRVAGPVRHRRRRRCPARSARTRR